MDVIKSTRYLRIDRTAESDCAKSSRKSGFFIFY
jgi:hypothetical protein